MKNFKILFITAIVAISIGSCKKLNTLLVDPNAPQPESGNVDLYLNQVQLAVVDFYANESTEPGLSTVGEELTRMEYMAARTYLDAYSPESFDTPWEAVYTSILKNGNALIPIAQKTNRHLHIGITRVIEAYTLATLVDFFGDVPFSEANLGNENTNPKADAGRAVYNAALALLDSAINSFGKVTSTTPLPSNDLFFANTSSNAATNKAASWRTVAKTLKLKLYNQTRLVDNTVKAKIDALITDGDLIKTDAQAFLFKFGSKAINPNSRHPKFSNYYTSSGAGDYIGNYYMWSVFLEKGANLDPRWRYYFYRQISDIPAQVPSSTLGCLGGNTPTHYPVGMPYCYADFRGFYGRDHGDDQGIPPDGQLRALWGVYPVGGRFDNSDAVKATGAEDGAKGQGILPMWQPAFTDFVLAEDALKLGTAGNPKTLLESAVRKSIATVVAFPATVGVTVPANRVPTQTAIDNYVTKVLSLYDAATTDDQRLDVIMKEYYIALNGNGIESYNNYRRTGMPKNMQPNINPTPGPYMRSVFYPGAYANRNSNVSQKTVTNVKVFWDNNPDNIYVP